MRIAIIIIGNTRRNSYLNGYNIRYGGGGASGTDTTSILMAEYLAKQGHEVVVCTDKLDEPLEEECRLLGRTYEPGSESYGVKYTNQQFEGIENKEFDILVSMLWFEQYDSLPITVTKSLIYWGHMQWMYGLDPILNFATKHNLSIGVINVSNWQKECSQGIVNHIKTRHPRTLQALIPNPILDELVREVQSENRPKKKGKFIFHATWPTGGNTALKAVRELDLPGKEFHALDYFLTVDNHTDDFFYNHKGSDRKTVFEHLAESEYFIYPLPTIHKTVRKDTFACTVAEAIAFGVIVLTYPLGALPENFKDFCIWLEAPPGVDMEEAQRVDLIQDPDGKFLYTQNIVDKINYLEANPEVKQYYQNVGKQYILENHSVNKIGAIWDTFLEDLSKI